MNRPIEYVQQTLGAELFPDAHRQALVLEHPSLLTPDDLGAREDMYVQALRTLVHVRRELPDDDEAVVAAEFRDRMRPAARRLAMLNNVEAYCTAYDNGDVGDDLLVHQHEPFRKMLAFLRQDAFREPGLITIPTAFGKSFLSIKMLEALGVGTPISRNETEKLRALYLVPRELLLHQVIGENCQRGFGRFAPNLTVTPYYGKEKDLSGDVVVMLYNSYIKATREGILDDQQFDVKMYDEGHHTLGKNISQAIVKHRELSPRVEIAMTASPEYNKEKAVSNLFPSEIVKVELHEAIRDGSLASVQCWLYETDSVLQINDAKRNNDFTDEELAPLRFDEKRNAHGVDFVAKFVESGRQGVIRCVAGDACAHAKEFAKLASSRTITDPETGEKRRLRVEATGDFQSDEQQQDTQERYDEGKIDAIAYVSMLDEGWDSPRTKFLLRLAPTSSRVVATQSLGRILRLYKRRPLAQVVEFMDIIDSAKKPVTFLDTLNIDLDAVDVGQGYIVGKKDTEDSEAADVTDEAEAPLQSSDFPDTLSKGLGRGEYKLVHKLLLKAQAIPEGWQTSSALMTYAGLKSYMGLFRFLERNDLPPIVSSTGRHYYAPEAREVIKQQLLDKIAPDTYEPVPSLREEFSTSIDRMRATLGRLSIETVMYKNASSLRDQLHVTAEDAQRLRDHFAESIEAEKSRTSFDDLAKSLNITTATLTKRIPEHITPTWERSAATSILQRYVTLEEAEHIRANLLPPPDSRTAQDLAREWGIGLNSVKEAVTKADEATASMGMHAESKRMHLHFPPKTAEAIRARCIAPQHKLNMAMIIDILGLDCTPEQFAGRLPTRLMDHAETWRVRRHNEAVATFFDADLLPAIGTVFKVRYSNRLEYCVPLEVFAMQLHTTTDAIQNYYPGGLHVRLLPDGDTRKLFVLPGPIKEIRKVPPAREGWLTHAEIVSRVKELSGIRKKPEALAHFLESRSGHDVAIMKPLGRNTTPKKHYSPRVWRAITGL